ncbi:hypothetical protein B0H13DRAFT_2386367 [Mycena leptocephala]|nr:hypothetical protein B0H13DRAFT_2386367 [Mycena leptocephala]
MVLVDRYATQSAIRASLSESESTAADRSNKVPVGREWVAPTTTVPPTHDAQDPDLPDLVDIIEGETTQKPPVPAKTPEDAPKVHQEKDGFTGDRVLRNSQIFMQDFGWWIEFAHAVPEGDIGRVWEIMKIWIFKYAGSSHQNYMAYLLEVYCMLRYEASKDLRNAILNNWLLNIMGELGNLGHAAVNQFARGWRRLEEEKLASFIAKSTALGDFLKEIRRPKDGDIQMRSDSPISDVSGRDSSDDDASARSGSDSPTPSIPRSDSAGRSFSTESSSSMRSLTEIDPNEPEDDGEDLSDAQISSAGIAGENGLTADGTEEAGNEENSEEEEQDDEPAEEDNSEEEESEEEL